MGHRRNELRNAAGLILKLRIIVAVQSEDQFLYAKFSAPLLLARVPSLHLLGSPHSLRHWAKAKDSPSQDIPSRGQGQECSRPRIKDSVASVFQKKVFKNFFQAISKRGKQKRFSKTFREVSDVFLLNLKNEQISTVVETNANAHHAIWGSSDINPRGEDLLAYCVSTDLNFCNVGNNPTSRTKTREEVQDLT